MVYLYTVTGAIGSNGITVLCHSLRFFGWAVHEGEKVMEIDDGDDGKTKCFLHLERLKRPLGHRPCRRVPYDLQQ